SNSLVTAEANGTLTWWDLRSARPWSRSTLVSPTRDVGATRLSASSIIYAFGARIQAVDTELALPWLPGAAQHSEEGRTDWADGEPIVALAATRDRIYVGNAQGRLLCWDDFGNQVFAVDLFAGPILQLAATSTSSGPVVVAVDSTQSTVALIDG